MEVFIPFSLSTMNQHNMKSHKPRQRLYESSTTTGQRPNPNRSTSKIALKQFKTKSYKDLIKMMMTSSEFRQGMLFSASLKQHFQSNECDGIDAYRKLILATLAAVTQNED
jgi:hypothetical protein